LLCGDFLRLPPAAIGPVGAFYDRAALVAVPPSSRIPYGQRLAQLLGPPYRGLLISFEYPTDERSGPPFSVDSAEINEALGPGLSARQIERNLLDDDHERRFGVSWVADAVYAVEGGP
jgi:thiopurine S-methyltransferase